MASGQPGQIFQTTSLLPVSCLQRVRKCGSGDVVNMMMAEDCRKLYGVLVQVGSRKYHVFRPILI